MHRRELIEKQIDFYFNNLAEIEIMQAIKEKSRSPDHKAAGPVSGSHHPNEIDEILPKIDKDDYLGKIRYLDDKYDEQ